MRLNDLQKDILQSLLSNNVLLATVRLIFEQTIEEEKPLVGKDDDDLVLGQKYRAYKEAQKLLNQSFTNLLSYKITQKGNKSFNKGR